MPQRHDGENTWWREWMRWGCGIGWRTDGALDHAGCWSLAYVIFFAALLFGSGFATAFILCYFTGH